MSDLRKKVEYGWCNHVAVRPVTGLNGQNNSLRISPGSQKVNLIYQDDQINILCDHCLRIQQQPLWPRATS